MGIFLDILTGFQNMNTDIDETEALSKFIGLLVNFNTGKPLKHDFHEKMYKYFVYRWNNDRNSAIDDQDEQEILNQLPDNV